MLTVDQKTEFISWIINLPIKEISSIEIQKLIHDQLLLDSDGGKLYKYRAFDFNGYSLKNLEDGTLHCSSPTSFNDPFDSKIGITFSSLYKAVLEKDLNLILHILDDFILAVRGEINIDECSRDEQFIIRQLMKNQSLTQLINEDYSWINTEKEQWDFFNSKISIIFEAIKIILENQDISPILRKCAPWITPSLTNITEKGLYILLKDSSNIKNFALANGITNDADEIDLAMLVTNIINPGLADVVVDVQNFLEEWDKNISLLSAEMFLIGCLSTDFKNRLMWSHYSDGHKGFCIEYDFSEPSEEILNMLPLPVLYSNKRPLIPWEAALEKTHENMENTWKELLVGLLTKDSEWSYENEWRIFTNTTNSPDLKMPPISCIYLGAAITEENKMKILEIAKIKKISVKQMKVDRGEYELHTQEVLSF